MVSLAVLPMTVMMMHVVPKNIEASMFSVITAAITFSTDWAGDLVGAIYCEFFGITGEDLSNFHRIMVVKIFMIVVSITLIHALLPSNETIKALGRRLTNLDNEEAECSDSEFSQGLRENHTA